MRKVLLVLLDPVGPGAGVCECERAGEGADVVAGVEAVGRNVERDTV